MNKEGQVLKNLSDSYLGQINILKALCRQDLPAERPRQFDISTIAELSGVNDEKEIQRYLYILEGRKWVAPHPPGDFTSKFWHITEDGLRAVQVIEREFV